MKLKKYQKGFWGEVIGAAISGGLSFLGGKERNEQQVSSAREQIQFQKDMSNTAHQRQVKDLRKAGLNPILSARYGGASTPSGAQADIKNVAGPAIETSIKTASAAAVIALTKKQTIAKEKEAELLEQQTLHEKSKIQETKVRTYTGTMEWDKIQGTINKLHQETRNLSEQQVLSKQQQVIRRIDILINQTKEKHDQEILRQLKTKMAEHVAKRDFWQAVGPSMIYADKAIKGGIGLAALLGMGKAGILKGGMKLGRKLKGKKFKGTDYDTKYKWIDKSTGQIMNP